MRIIMHLDLDAFFAAVEERENLELKGKPVIIGADPKQGKGRGVVSTANYEARKYGLYSGMPIALAWRKCPHGIYLRPRIDFYEQVSDKIMAMLRKHADALEQVSIDEAYLDISKRCKNFEQAKQLALKIKKEIRAKEKLTCSIGIGPNKLVAKIAAGMQKPDGLTIVKPKEVEKFLEPLSVRKIPGIGPKTDQKLCEMGIKTIKELKKLSRQELIDQFGSFGSEIYESARGIDESPVQEAAEIKSIGTQYTFEYDTRDKKLIYDKLRELVNLAHAQAREQGFSFKTVTIKVRYHDFETHTSARTLKQASISQLEAFRAASELLRPWLASSKRIRLIGVSLSKLQQEQSARH